MAGDHPGAGSRYALIALLALALGIQNATARRLAVAELTTTVLTLTLTGIAADSWLGGGSGARTPRRVLSVGAMLLGAILGAVLLPPGGTVRAARPGRNTARARHRNRAAGAAASPSPRPASRKSTDALQPAAATCRLPLPESVFPINHPVDRTVNLWVVHTKLLTPGP